MTPKRRRAFERARKAFEAATAHMSDAELEAEIDAIVAEVRREVIARQLVKFSDSARTMDIVWNINTRADR